jgi:hypothetical protein
MKLILNLFVLLNKCGFTNTVLVWRSVFTKKETKRNKKRCFPLIGEFFYLKIRKGLMQVNLYVEVKFWLIIKNL